MFSVIKILSQFKSLLYGGNEILKYFKIKCVFCVIQNKILSHIHLKKSYLSPLFYQIFTENFKIDFKNL